ncbi:MAG: S9 family peptidase [Filimonas sp.]|nr:S9 family peptidase [Filimonas sp.]
MIQRIVTCICVVLIAGTVYAQPQRGYNWTKDGKSYYQLKDDEIVKVSLPDFSKSTVVSKLQLTPSAATAPLKVRNFFFSADDSKVLIYTNSKRVWRYETRGDYWVLNTANNQLKQVGKGLPESSLMFAKFSPDASKVAYVSLHNIYVEDLATGKKQQLTKDGTDHMINGTFDWAYEEEFGCRDGFRWSPDGKSIAYWQIDATKIRNFLMINNTDSIYSHVVPVEYPKVGESPSACRVGVITVATGKTKWMNVPGDQQQHYIPRMEWAANSTELVIEQLNRKQNEAKVMYCNIATGATNTIYTETDKAWIDIKERWNGGDPAGWEWMPDGKSFLWVTEKDGWRHIYLVSRDGKQETLITNGNYDIITIKAIDEKSGYVYFTASPDNATQEYLYKIKMDGKSSFEKLSPADQKGTHDYQLSPNGLYARHTFSNANTPTSADWVSLADGKVFFKEEAPQGGGRRGGGGNANAKRAPVEFIRVTTVDGVTLDGYLVKPLNFDSTKKYPVVFEVYTEPASQTVKDRFGIGRNREYAGDMAADGYIYMSFDGRGTPAAKGAAWRKAIYRNIGRINIRDQAMAAKEVLKWPFVDSSRIAVWGWSGGGSTTLNLLFQYPEIYKTGIAVAAVGNQLTYDNIYQERYMGLPQENREDFVQGSPVTYAKNLKGNLLYIHGTGDDNVHYQNAEMLLNELIKYNKQFQFMAYPNRSHGIYEGEGTSLHLQTLYTNYLKQYCPPGGR